MSTLAVHTTPVYDHLIKLSDSRGLFEHALLEEPRPEHGYCVDDVARGLVVLMRVEEPSPELIALTRRYLDFVLAAVQPDGTCRNRMNVDGEWADDASFNDHWGRAIWGLGCTAAKAPTHAIRLEALHAFRRLAVGRSTDTRAMAFAALGAGELLLVRPDDTAARRLLLAGVKVIGSLDPDPAWRWPESTLRYANAAIAEALLVAGDGLFDKHIKARGLEALRFLLEIQTRNGVLSLVGVGGRDKAATGPSFDQQPIEAAALADACARAYRMTEDPQWLSGVQRCWAWFTGSNDSSTVMLNPTTGAGYDGLEVDGANRNCGAESTLAALATAQHAQRLAF